MQQRKVMNPINMQRFKIGDRVKLIRDINGKSESFRYSAGTIGVVAQICHLSAIKVDFSDDRLPVVASIYLTHAGNIND